MPRYEYHCAECGVFEDDHKMDIELVCCPNCDRQIRKLISKVNITTDTIDAYYHPKAQMWCDSNQALKQLDEATGCTTYDYDKKPELTAEQIRKNIDDTLTEDRRRSWDVAVQKYDAGTIDLTEEQRAICKKKNNIIAHQIGKDSFKHNGKQYKLRTPE